MKNHTNPRLMKEIKLKKISQDDKIQDALSKDIAGLQRSCPNF